MEEYDSDFAREVGRRLAAMTPQERAAYRQPPQGPREPLDEKDAEIARLKMQLAAVRGTVIGAIASGHMDDPVGRSILLPLAADLGIEIGPVVVDSKGEVSEREL